MALGVLVTACGSPAAGTHRTAARSERSGPPSARATILRPGDARAVPNPGTGRADPRVAAALLTRFQDSVAARDLPGAVVAMPVLDRASMYIGLRQVSSPLDGGRPCAPWTAGLWRGVLDANTRGVQLGVTEFNAMTAESVLRGRRPANPLVFSEAIITGAPPADPNIPPQCAHLPSIGHETGDIQPLSVPPAGDRSWAYRVTGSGEIPIWQWVEVVQTRRYLLEIRIPNQAPLPKTRPEELLPKIAQAACAKADAALG
jgi:hypothetical protein